MVFIDRIYGRLKENAIYKSMALIFVVAGIFLNLDTVFYSLLILLNLLISADIIIKFKGKYHNIQAFLTDVTLLTAGLAVASVIALYVRPLSASLPGLSGHVPVFCADVF